MNKTEFISDSEEHSTMQDFSSTVSFSPSFSFYVSGDANPVETAVRVVRESQSHYSVTVDGDDNDADFEFETSPLREESLFHFPTTTFKLPSEEDDVAADRVNLKNLFYGGWDNIDRSPPSPSQSNSSLESDDFGSLSPSRYYCFWSPIRSPARGDSSKTKSSSVPKRCRFKDLLRRSHSDGAVSTSSASKRCSFKDLLRRSHSDGGRDTSSSSSSGNRSPTVKGKNITALYKPQADKSRKSYLPYRQDLIGVFAGMSRFRR